MEALKQPCEVGENKVLPAIRAELARVLVTDGGLKQTEVSDLLGITQAAVSFYTREKRGSDLLTDEYPEILESIKVLADDILSGLSPAERASRICDICREFRRNLSPDALKEL